MADSEFLKQYRILNKAQKEAVDAIEGPVMVIAGPGTGKTTILTLRIANILRKTDTPPDAILALTFTESGVRAMRVKLSGLIGVRAYDVHIHTFHSFANDLIKMYPDKFPRIIGAEHMEELEQRRIMQEAIDSACVEMLRPRNDPSYYVSHCITAIQELKRENIDPQEFKKLVRRQKAEFLNRGYSSRQDLAAVRPLVPSLAREKETRGSLSLRSLGRKDVLRTKSRYTGEMKGSHQFALEKTKKNEELVLVYKEYEKILEKKRLYDFDDMLMEVVQTLEQDKDLLLRLQEEFHYILADEHQDANNAQNTLLELLSSFHKNPNLFIVGDEKQAIFRFQGASLENFLYFKRLYKDAIVIFLEENYRSHQTILDAGHTIMSANQPADPEFRRPLKARAGRKPKKIKVIMTATKEAERAYIASSIKALVTSGVPPSEIAVLIRENKDAEALERALSNESLPVARFAGFDALAHPRIASFIEFLQAVSEPSNEKLGRVLFFDYLDLAPHDVFVFLEETRKNRTPVIKALVKNKSFSGFAARLSRWHSILKNEVAVLAFNTLAEECGYIKHLTGLADAHELFGFYEALLRSVERFTERDKKGTLSDFLEHLAEASAHGLKLAVEASALYGVNIMTAHGAKGLEFDVVYIAHAVDGVWGGRRKRSLFDLPIAGGAEDHELQDERRLFYVALTRARTDAYISYYLRGEDSRERTPSRFIAEIDPVQKEEISVEPKILPIISYMGKPKLLEDKTYLNSLFLERGLSVTHLNNFLECPWRYFFVDLVRIPKSQEGSLLYGNACHAALKAYFDAYAREEDLPMAKILELFENLLRRTHLTGRDLDSYLSAGRKELGKYLLQKNFPRIVLNEYKIRGIPLQVGTQEILLNGSLDKIELQDGSNVNVVDYKTGRPQSRSEIEGKTKNSDGNYKRQLVFYKLLLDRQGKWKMRTGTIDFIRPNDRGHFRREVFEVTEREVEELKKSIVDVSKQIFNLSFWNMHCDDKNCQYCKLSNVLAHTKH